MKDAEGMSQTEKPLGAPACSYASMKTVDSVNMYRVLVVHVYLIYLLLLHSYKLYVRIYALN